MPISTPDPNLSSAGVLDALRASGKPLHEWGRAIDGTPLLAARTGGDKQPVIFITAGSHAPETAGVHAALNLLWGKRVMVMCASAGVEGTGEMRRCWHGVFSAGGEWLHLNRFFGRADAPAEVAAVDQLMQTLRPGLTCDLHEGNGSGFWM